MAPKAHPTVFPMVQYGLIAWDHDALNVSRRERRPKKDREILRNSLAKDGWLPTKGVVPVFDSKSPCFKKEGCQKIIEGVVAKRQALYDDLKKNAGNKRIELDVFIALFCDKDGELLVPIYVGNACHGRSEEYYDSQVMRAKGERTMFDSVQGETTKIVAADPVVMVPFYYRVYQTTVERIVDQVD